MTDGRRSLFTKPLAGLAIACIAALVAGCGDTSAPGAGGSAKPVSPTIPASGCGSFALRPPPDPDGVVAALPKNYQDEYAGYVTPVRKSVWANFKPNHPPPYRIAIAFGPLLNDGQNKLYESITKELKSNPEYKVTAVSSGDALNIPLQLQQYQALVNDKPDLMIIQPLADAFGPLVEKAGKQGIPTVSLQGATENKYAINVQGNNYANGGLSASVALRQVRGKGNVVYMHGVSTSTVDRQVFNGYSAVLKGCPQAKQVGEIAGAFTASLAKSETLRYLATHPEPIAAVIQTGAMAAGIMDAFKEVGRPMPAVGDIGGMKGSLGYWTNNRDSYAGFAQPFPAPTYGRAVAGVAKRVLAGRGLKVSDITSRYPTVTLANLDEWADKSWNLKTSGSANGPPQSFLSDDYLGGLFNDPSPVK